jgi:DNA-binding NarL/FixJ family response regulator
MPETRSNRGSTRRHCILLVDDHYLIREAVRGVLWDLEEDLTVLETSNCRQMMRLVEENSEIQTILLDVKLPDGNGLEAMAELRKRRPEISVIFLSAIEDPEIIINALNLGALGFIPKSADRNVLLKALQLIFSGGKYLPEIVLDADATWPQSVVENGIFEPAISPAKLGLTGGQLRVLALLMEGKSNKAICQRLDLAEPTVKNHVSAVLRALRVTNRTEAVVAVGKLGWDFSGLADP